MILGQRITGEHGTGADGGSRDGQSGESVTGCVTMQIDRMPEGRLRNVGAGGVRGDDRRGPLHPTSRMSDTPFWPFVILLTLSKIRPCIHPHIPLRFSCMRCPKNRDTESSRNAAFASPRNSVARKFGTQN